MSELKHGLFSSGFMLCDRCVSNSKYEKFKPGNNCILEKEECDETVAKLIEEYDLDEVADLILAKRAGMYLIRINRAEAYEATVGLNEKTACWDTYIGRLDSMLKGLFNDLAISRAKRMSLEKGEGMLVSINEVIRKFTSSEKKNAQSSNPDIKMRQLTILFVRKELLKKWEEEYPKLKSILKKENKHGQEKK
jgi:hypothetical protein